MSGRQVKLKVESPSQEDHRRSGSSKKKLGGMSKEEIMAMVEKALDNQKHKVTVLE